MPRRVAPALLLLVALLFAFACADEDHDASKPIISEASLTKLFTMIDKDVDGRATVAELKSFSQEMVRMRGEGMQMDVMSQLDADKDGRLTFVEVLPSPDFDTPEGEESYKWERKKFRAADKDDDHFLDMAELASFLHASADPQVEEVVGAAGLQRKDTDGDGKLNLREFVGVGSAKNRQGLPITEEDRAHFSKLDKDGDGKLTAKEFGPLESGRLHLDESMQWIVTHADADGDGLALDELVEAREKLEAHDLSVHLDEWAHLLEL